MRGLREAFDFKAIAKEFSKSVIDFVVREAAPDLCFLDGDGWTAIAVVYFRMPGGNKFESLCVSVSVSSVTGTWSHLRLSQHTLSVQTMASSVDRALCFPSGPRLVRIPECGREYMLSSLWFGLGLYAFGMENGVHLPIVCVTVTLRVHAVVCYHSTVY